MVMSEHVDMESLNELKEVMEEEYALLLETYLSDSIERIDRIKKSASDTDAEALRQAAHSLKGSSSNLGAVILTGLCREAEDMGRENSLQGIDPLVERIEQEYLLVKPILEDELSGLH